MHNTATNITKQHVLTKDQYESFITAWKRAATRRNLRAADFVIFNWVKGRALDTGFTPITNQIKLDNGMYLYDGFDLAKIRANQIKRYWSDDKCFARLQLPEDLQDTLKF